jgi:lysophospholipase L1-like esterase
MKLYSYGDSWTEGVGVNKQIESSLTDTLSKKEYRNQFSYPKYLSDLLSINYENRGIAGCCNKQIFDEIINDIKSNKIIEGDLVTILWSSSLRDNVSFFPQNEWHSWGLKYIEEEHLIRWGGINGELTKNATYNKFIHDYKMFYVTQLFNQNYYNIVNQNYIIFLQKLFEHHNIKYIMADAFDSMIIDINKDDDRTSHISKDLYWNFSLKTLKDHLIDLNDTSLWEDNLPFGSAPGKHPSITGYKKIAEELYRFINSNNILNIKFNKKINII